MRAKEEMGFWTNIVLAIVLVALVGTVYYDTRGRCKSARQFTNLLRDHIIAKSIDAAESGNHLSSLLKISQAQAALDVLSHVAGGDEPLSKLCTDDIQNYRAALHEQYAFYSSQLQPRSAADAG